MVDLGEIVGQCPGPAGLAVLRGMDHGVPAVAVFVDPFLAEVGEEQEQPVARQGRDAAQRRQVGAIDMGQEMQWQAGHAAARPVHAVRQAGQAAEPGVAGRRSTGRPEAVQEDAVPCLGGDKGCHLVGRQAALFATGPVLVPLGRCRGIGVLRGDRRRLPRGAVIDQSLQCTEVRGDRKPRHQALKPGPMQLCGDRGQETPVTQRKPAGARAQGLQVVCPVKVLRGKEGQHVRVVPGLPRLGGVVGGRTWLSALKAKSGSAMRQAKRRTANPSTGTRSGRVMQSRHRGGQGRGGRTWRHWVQGAVGVPVPSLACGCGAIVAGGLGWLQNARQRRGRRW